MGLYYQLIFTRHRTALQAVIYLLLSYNYGRELQGYERHIGDRVDVRTGVLSFAVISCGKS